jgi:DNA-directed RNA polymerase specialized sigma24 family protein
MDLPSDRPSAARFPTTHWSRVIAAGGRASADDRDALAELCRAYWYPLYAFIRRKGFQPEDAQDLTQAYFARLLQSGALAAAEREKGRFRSFLHTDCGYFLSDQRDRERALKRGGGHTLVSIDIRDAEGRYLVEPADALTPDRLFDRVWAITLIDGALDSLARECTHSGRATLFERLKSVLTGGPGDTPYATIAAELGMTEVAVQSAAHRLRRRYRDLIRERIAATLKDPSSADVEEEIQALFAALGR